MPSRPAGAYTIYSSESPLNGAFFRADSNGASSLVTLFPDQAKQKRANKAIVVSET